MQFYHIEIDEMKTSRKLLLFLLSCMFVFGMLVINGCQNGEGPIKKIKKHRKEKTEKTVADKPGPKIEGQKPLKLTINNLESSSAEVRVAFFTKDNEFLNKEDVFKRYKFKPTSANSLTVEIDDLKYGEYAISTYQDVDGNGEIEKTKIGVPKEPYGFSNDVKPGMSKPKFDECKFTYDEKSNTQTIQMLGKDNSDDKAAESDKKDKKKNS